MLYKKNGIKLSNSIYKYLKSTNIIFVYLYYFFSMDYVYILSIVCCGALFFVNRDNKRYIADLHTRVKYLELAEHRRHHEQRLKNNIDIHSSEEIEICEGIFF